MIWSGPPSLKRTQSITKTSSPQDTNRAGFTRDVQKVPDGYSHYLIAAIVYAKSAGSIPTTIQFGGCSVGENESILARRDNYPCGSGSRLRRRDACRRRGNRLHPSTAARRALSGATVAGWCSLVDSSAIDPSAVEGTAEKCAAGCDLYPLGSRSTHAAECLVSETRKLCGRSLCSGPRVGYFAWHRFRARIHPWESKSRKPIGKFGRYVPLQIVAQDPFGDAARLFAALHFDRDLANRLHTAL